VVLKTKKIIREEILTLLRQQKEEERLKKSEAIMVKLFNLPEFQHSQTILFYASFDGEVETFLMMKQAKKEGKRIALPTIIEEEKRIIPKEIKDIDKGLLKGPYGIQQPGEEFSKPLAPKDIDLVVVPGVAFDKDNNRLGRGQGYYDRFLRDLSPGTPTVGLAFDFQVINSLPHQQEHDIPVFSVICN